MFDSLKEFLSKKNLINLLLLGIMILAIPLSVNLVRQQQILRSRAANEPISIKEGNGVTVKDGKKYSTSRSVKVVLNSPFTTQTADSGSDGLISEVKAQDVGAGAPAEPECDPEKQDTWEQAGYPGCVDGRATPTVYVSTCDTEFTPRAKPEDLYDDPACSGADETVCWSQTHGLQNLADDACTSKYNNGQLVYPSWRCNQFEPGPNGDGCFAPSTGAGGNSCRNNPVTPPAGTKWTADCNRSCSNNNGCDKGVNNQEGWCYGFDGGPRCLKLEFTQTATTTPAFDCSSCGTDGNNCCDPANSCDKDGDNKKGDKCGTGLTCGSNNKCQKSDSENCDKCGGKGEVCCTIGMRCPDAGKGSDYRCDSGLACLDQGNKETCLDPAASIGDKGWCGGDRYGRQHTSQSCSGDNECISGNCNFEKGKKCDSRWGPNAPCSPEDYISCDGFSDRDALVSAYYCKNIEYDGDISAHKLISESKLPCSEIGKNGLVNTYAPCINTASAQPPGTSGQVKVFYKLAEDPSGLNDFAQFTKQLQGAGTEDVFEFAGSTPGEKFVFVRFIAKNTAGDIVDRSNPASDKVILLGAAPRLQGCAPEVSTTGTGVKLTLTGTDFRNNKGQLTVNNTPLPQDKILSWKNDQIVALSEGGVESTRQVKITNEFGQESDTTSCAVNLSQIELKIRPACRSASQQALSKVSIKVVESATGSAKQQVFSKDDNSSDNEGKIRLPQQLQQGKEYDMLIDTPGYMAKKVSKFKPSAGTTNLGTVDLSWCDIYPAAGDGSCNSFDKAELNRQWIIATSASGRSGDCNSDGRVNTIDWSSMRSTMQSQPNNDSL